jgi:hypothetical protein
MYGQANYRKETAMTRPAFTEVPEATPPLSPWPYSLIRLSEASRTDWLRFWTEVAEGKDPVDEVRAEGELAFNLWRDWMNACADLSLLPLRAWSAAVAPPQPPSSQA